VNPFTSKAISRDGRSALAQIQYTVSRPNLHSDSLPALVAATKPAQRAGLVVHAGGDAYSSTSAKPGPSTAIGAVIAYGILFITFGSLLAAGLPLLTALGGLAVGVSGVYLVSHIATVSSTAPSLALMIGLAVGIDYSVFILSRYRSELAAGRTARDAIGVALGTAGSAVVFAGSTVFVALAASQSSASRSSPSWAYPPPAPSRSPSSSPSPCSPQSLDSPATASPPNPGRALPVARAPAPR
jgi:putative drug exporter of the RND superfamily